MKRGLDLAKSVAKGGTRTALLPESRRRGGELA